MILGCDPGIKNFGLATLEVGDHLLVSTSYLVPLSRINKDSVSSFIDEVSKLLKEKEPSIVVIERYMFRGSSSIHAELNNLMIGIFLSLRPDIELITPVSWKMWAEDSYRNMSRGKEIKICGFCKKNYVCKRGVFSLGCSKYVEKRMDISQKLFPFLDSEHKACALSLCMYISCMRRRLTENVWKFWSKFEEK